MRNGHPLDRDKLSPVYKPAGMPAHSNQFNNLRFHQPHHQQHPIDSPDSSPDNFNGLQRINPQSAQQSREKFLKKMKTPAIDNLKTQTWHDYPMERKTLKRHKIGPADYYPQVVDQDEDKLTPERILKGFYPNIMHCEYDSCANKVSAFWKLEDTSSIKLHAASFIEKIRLKRMETNVINFDRKKLKDLGFVQPEQTIAKLPQSLIDITRKPYTSLCKRLPSFKTSDEAMEMLFSHRIDIPHALWYLKVGHIGQMVQTKTKKAIEPADMSPVFLKIIKSLLEKVDEEQSAAKLKWKYFTTMIRHAVMDGCVERQDFLMDLAEILFETHQKCTLEKMLVYKMMISFVSMFTREIVQNVFLSRRFFYILGLRLRAYLDECEKKKKARVSPKQAFSELLNCSNHKSIILNTFGIVAAIIVDCPAACVWTPLEVTHVPECLVGSPLDTFPIDPLLIPSFLRDTSEFGQDFKKILAVRLQEIHKRSSAADNRWSLNSRQETGFQAIVHACFDVISLLDTADLTSPRGLYVIYAKVFGLTRESEIFEDETLVRVRAMLQWAVTYEREGTYRAALVTKLLQLHVKHFRTNHFDDKPINQVLVDFLDREGPKPGTPGYRQQFTNLVLLFVELQRLNLFPHNDYIQLLMRYNKLPPLTEPIIQKVRKRLKEEAPTGAASNQQGTEKGSILAGNPSSVNPPAIISFIPTSDSAEKPVDPNDDIEWVKLKVDDGMNRQFLEKPENITLHERLLIQLPIEQTEANRGAINQRNTYLFGITDERNVVQIALRKFAHDVAKNFVKHSIRFHYQVKEIRRRSYVESLSKQMTEFKNYTFYDQQVIAGICADEYMKIVSTFGKNGVNMLPDMECLDMLSTMFESAQCLGSLLAFFVELIPVFLDCETVLDSFKSDYIPGTFSSQQAYIIVGLLADHYKYFLLSRNAITLTNGLYRIIEREVKFDGYPVSGWARAVAVFLIQARFDLRNCEDAVFAFRARDVRKLQPSPDYELTYVPNRYNPKLFADLLDTPRRCLSYHELKLHMPSVCVMVESNHSFAVNAFTAALSFETDFDKLAELANFCGTVSAMKNLEDAWINLIISACSPVDADREQPGFEELLNFSDFSKHYAFATFSTLLAAKFCFSAHTLLLRLNNVVLLPCLNNSQYTPNMHKRLPLVFQIITNIVTATDEPIQLSKRLFYPNDHPRRILNRSADLRCLRIPHIRELDAVILPILTNIFFYVESIKKKDEFMDIYNFGWNCVLTISDEEWVIQRMFQICHSDRDIDDFNTGQFGRDSLGQYLMRIALRRRSERELKIQLVSNKGTKKALIEKLFSVLTVWNLRAAYCDIRVMIKAVNGKLIKHPAQSVLQTETLLKEISRSCRDVFINQPEKFMTPAPNVEQMRFADVSSVWLLSELIDVITPDNVTKTIKSIFLDDVAAIFSVMASDDKERVRKLKASANLLSLQPFVNLVLTCQNGEEKARDNLIHSMFIHAKDMMKQREDPELRRECLLLRMNLIGSMLDFTPQTTDTASFTLFGMLLWGVISPERDGDYFVNCFDMLMMCVLGLYCGSHLPMINTSGETTRLRYHEYASFVKAVRKEMGDRTLPDHLKCLEQLLPVPRPSSELAAFSDWFSSASPQKPSSKGCPASGANFARNVKSIRVDRIANSGHKRLQRLLYHSHQWEFFHPGVPGLSLNKNQLEAHVLGPHDYAEATKVAPPPPLPPPQPTIPAPSLSSSQPMPPSSSAHHQLPPPRSSPMGPMPPNAMFRPPQGMPPGYPSQPGGPPPGMHYFSGSGGSDRSMMLPPHSQGSGFSGSGGSSGGFPTNGPNGPMNFGGGPGQPPPFNMMPPQGHPGMRAPGMTSTRAQAAAAIRRKIPGGGVVNANQTPPGTAGQPMAKRAKREGNDMGAMPMGNPNQFYGQVPPNAGQWPPGHPGIPGPNAGFPPRMPGAPGYGGMMPNHPGPPQQAPTQPPPAPQQQQQQHPQDKEVRENLRQKLQIRRQSKQLQQMPQLAPTMASNPQQGGPPPNAPTMEQQRMMFLARQQHQQRMMANNVNGNVLPNDATRMPPRRE